MIDRRTAIGLIGGAFGAVLASRANAQPQSRMLRLAVATFGLSEEQLVDAGLVRQPPKPIEQLTGGLQQQWRLFFEELARLGWIEGETMAIERWSTIGITDIAGRAPIIAAIAASEPDVICVQGDQLAPQVAAAITTIPIVALVNDPVELGMVQNLARPEGNVTGTATRPGGQSAFDARVIALLNQIVPSARRIAWVGPARGLGPDALAAAGNVRAVELLAASGIEAVIIPSDPPSYSVADLEAWQIRLVQRVIAERCGGVYFTFLPEFYFPDAPRYDFWPRLLLEAGLPSICNSVNFVRAGALASFGYQVDNLWVVSAQYVDRILRGTPISGLPFHMADRTTFVINQRTADALGITVAVSLLVAATEIIE